MWVWFQNILLLMAILKRVWGIIEAMQSEKKLFSLIL